MRTAFALILLAACGDITTPPPSGIPGLYGLVPSASTDRPTRASLDKLRRARTIDVSCAGNSSGALELVGDVLGTGDAQTVLVAFDRVIVVDASNAVVAEAPTGLDCRGASATLEAASLGRAWLDTPLVAVAATVGDSAQRSTIVTLYQPRARALVPIFSGAIEAREGPDSSWVGSITLVPSGLVYRAPGDPTTFWVFDRARGRYVERVQPVAWR